MRLFYNLILASTLLYIVFWFIRFEYNPYEYCIDHPNEELRDQYYLCQPFDFELKKGLLENKNRIFLGPPVYSDDQL